MKDSEDKKVVWYISKYFEVPTARSDGGRGFLLLEELVKIGYEVMVITSDSNHLNETPKFSGIAKNQQLGKLNVKWVKTLKYKRAKSIGRILSWLDFELKLIFFPKCKLKKPDVVVASSLSLLSVISGLIFKFIYKSKLIFEVRDIWPLTLTEEGGYSEKNLLVYLLSLVEKVGYKYSDYIVGTMPNLKEHVENIHGKDVQNVACLPMGVSQDKFNKFINAEDRNEFSRLFPENKIIVGYAGTIGITNALENYFTTIQEMSADQRFYFVVIGGGDLLDYYKEKYSHLENLSFIPKVSKREVPSILKYVDILYLSTFPSEIWRYGQSLNKIIDYMLSAKPIIASYNGYPSMINEADCGQFIPINDNKALVEKMIEYGALSQSERTTIGLRGRKWLWENRRYQKIAQDLDEIIKKIL